MRIEALRAFRVELVELSIEWVASLQGSESPPAAKRWLIEFPPETSVAIEADGQMVWEGPFDWTTVVLSKTNSGWSKKFVVSRLARRHRQSPQWKITSRELAASQRCSH